MIETINGSAVVTVDPYENPLKFFTVELAGVWALPSFCDGLLGDLRGLLKLVHDPFQVFPQ